MAGDLNGKRILIVEDDFFILAELEHTLSEDGAEVTSARTVEHALAKLDSSDFSGAILDFRLGGQNVSPVAAALTQRSIPFVFYTGQTTDELAEWSYVRIIPKPSPSQTILAAVHDWL